LHYDFSLDVITRKLQPTQKAVLIWCQQHELQKPLIRNVEESCGWTSFTVFSSYLQNRNSLTLKDNDTKTAHKKLLSILQKIDKNVRIRTDWLILDKYMRLEEEIAKWTNKTSQLQTEIDSEEANLCRASMVHETEDFAKDEDVLGSGTRKDVLNQFKLGREDKRKSNRSQPMPLLQA
jgi:hypothetical protein